MAIQNRRGVYTDFDVSKMVAGEIAVVQSGDPSNTDGKAIYIAFQNGSVARLILASEMGSLSSLETTAKASIVDAINELTEKSSILFGSTTTAGSDRDKVVVCEDFVRTDGALIIVSFSQTNTVNNARLNINGTGVCNIYNSQNTNVDTSWLKKGYYLFRYYSTNGGRYTLVGALERIPSDDAPLMDGTASAGTSDKYSRGDHVHPKDTSKADVTALQAEADARAAKDTELDGKISDVKEDYLDISTIPVIYKDGLYVDDGGFVGTRVNSQIVLIDLTTLNRKDNIHLNIVGTQNRCRLLFTNTNVADVVSGTSGSYIDKGSDTNKVDLNYAEYGSYSTLVVCTNFQLTPYARVNASLYIPLSYLNDALLGITDALPWYKTYPTNIFSHGQVLYGSGSWSYTMTRWGTKDLQYTETDLYLSIKDYTPALNYQICFFDSNGTYLSWSGWHNKDSAPYRIPGGSYYKITIARVSDSSDSADVDYLFQLLIDTEIKKYMGYTDALREQIQNAVPGIPYKLQLVRGYHADQGGRPRPTQEQMNRIFTTYEPVYLYKGGYLYCDTTNLYRYSLYKYKDAEGNQVESIIANNDVIPLSSNKVVIPSDGYYCLNFQRYDNSRITKEHFNAHVTLLLNTNKRNAIFPIFIGGGKENFQAPGDANLIIGETGEAVMIDCGLNNTQGQMWSCMEQNGIQKPDYIIISHMHNDHIGGLVRLLDNNLFTLDDMTLFLPSQSGIDYAIANGILNGSSLEYYNQLMAYINSASNLNVIRPATEFEEYYIDGMTFRFWNVDHQPYIDLEDTNYNDYSLCCNLEYGNQRLCYTGDLGPIGMGLNAGKNYKSNVYKAQHHGWDNITAAADIQNMKKWLSTVFPEIVISEDGITHDTLLLNDNAPMPDWCEKNGIPFYRTNQNGFIYVRVDYDSWDITTPVIRWTKAENPAT